MSGVLLSLMDTASLPAAGQGEECDPLSLLRLTLEAPLAGVPRRSDQSWCACSESGCLGRLRRHGGAVPPAGGHRPSDILPAKRLQLDGNVQGEVTDAVFLLQYSFGGGKPPPCLVACDANVRRRACGPERAVYTLSYDFVGGPPPPGPFPDCEPVEPSATLPYERPTENCR